MLWRRIARPRPDVDRSGAALVNDLIEAAIEAGQRLCDSVVSRGGWCRRVCRCGRCRRGRNGTRLRVRARHAFELVRQRIETLVDGSEIFADVLVVIRFPV
jgi:hypothetical protein